MSLEFTSHRKHLETELLLKEAFNSVGARRVEVEKALSGMSDDEVALVVSYDGARVAVNKDGDEILMEKGTAYKAVNDVLKGLQGSAPGNVRIGEVIVPAGVCAIVGAGNTGKSPLSHALASSGKEEYAVVRVGEPLSGYASSKYESALDLARAMLKSPCVVVDSIKDVLSSGSGAAMKSGLNRDALTAVSTWSAQACDLGTTLFIPINPSTPEPGVVAMIAEAAKSNATSCLLYAGGTSWEFFARTGEGMERVHAFLTFTKDGKLIMDVDRDSSPEKDEARIRELVVKQVSDFDATISRLMYDHN